MGVDSSREASIVLRLQILNRLGIVAQFPNWHYCLCRRFYSTVKGSFSKPASHVKDCVVLTARPVSAPPFRIVFASCVLELEFKVHAPSACGEDSVSIALAPIAYPYACKCALEFAPGGLARVCMKIGVSGANLPSASKSQIKWTKSLMNLVVIFNCSNSLKISYENGRVSVRIFYKNNLISVSVYFLILRRSGASPTYATSFLQCPHAVEVVLFQTLLSSLFDRASLFCVSE